MKQFFLNILDFWAHVAQRFASDLLTCLNAPPQGPKTRNQRALFSFEEKSPKTAPLGPFGSLRV